MDISVPGARRFVRRSMRGSLVFARDLLDRRITRLEGVEGRLLEAAAEKKTPVGSPDRARLVPPNREEDRPAGVQ